MFIISQANWTKIPTQNPPPSPPPLNSGHATLSPVNAPLLNTLQFREEYSSGEDEGQGMLKWKKSGWENWKEEMWKMKEYCSWP
jgi:hypothetical protein